jgi:C4-dicarboxylate-specific signal transduction histidine kinase
MKVDVRGTNFTTSLDLVVEECCKCGVVFAMTRQFQRECRNSPGPAGRSFYCPNGHGQHYTGKTDSQREREKREEAERRAVQLESDRSWYQQRLRDERDEHKTTQHKLRGTKGALTNAQRRAARGVCPVKGCHRHFANVQAHVERQHPDYVTEHGSNGQQP